MNEFEEKPQFESFTESDNRIREEQYGITYEDQKEIELERIRYNFHHPVCQMCGRQCMPKVINWTIYEICYICDLSRLEHPNWRELLKECLEE